MLQNRDKNQLKKDREARKAFLRKTLNDLDGPSASYEISTQALLKEFDAAPAA